MAWLVFFWLCNKNLTNGRSEEASCAAEEDAGGELKCAVSKSNISFYYVWKCGSVLECVTGM